ncbi:trans-cinnamate:CoA ligase, peroxisomal-like [Nicotiana tomentosiformis]|uniref:trans-cinnamate:CoA ligase, peroxisomal-like n=1 Tax=Nicotiana tomentosiformis TaxID=4098 RepID=UPI00051AF0C2|nr:butyrate--CoA ligase AAE11, peroxisomal-like isoform X2 [Nicotiana tomentosiformis]
MDRLPKCGANYVPLTPLTFLTRASKCYANRISIIHGGVRFTWSQTYERCCRLASSLRSLNIVKNDVVSVLAPNVPAMYEMHFAVPMAGAVLNAINTRLDAKNIAVTLKHSEAKVFLVDYEYLEIAKKALELLVADFERSKTSEMLMPLVIVIDDINSPTGIRLGELEYEQLVFQGNPSYIPEEITDEWDPITLSYTSGTTSEPKGVVYSHRGAYLSTLSLILGWEMGTEPVYLWSLPMFHCNGWTFTWGIAARGGTNICIRNTTAQEMYTNIVSHNVTHMCCAPIVFNILLEAKPYEYRPITTRVQILTGGAPPPAPLLEKIERLGFHVVHAYGLTEATGPALVCEWQQKWNKLPSENKSKLKARQGVGILTLADVDVKNFKNMQSVPRDGKSIGEICLRGSSIMKGYFKNDKANSEVFKNGWFFTGDVGVIHSDGYLEIKDRSKDVIISGGENISSIEVENAIMRHPNVVEVSVVAMPHFRWGESPCAFVIMSKNSEVKEVDIIAHCRSNLPGFMVPKKVKFVEELPKTGTGKVQKHHLRAIAKTFVISEKSNQISKKTSQVNREKTRYYDQNQEQILALSRL